MLRCTARIKDWLPPVAAVCAVILAAGYAVSRKSHAAEKIHEVGDLGTTLSDAARLTQDGTLSQDEIEKLKALQNDLESRMADALEPSLVQAGLVKSASQVGLVLRGIEPFHESARRSGKNEPADYPRYRVSVSGTYEQVARYMQLCSRQRLPARVAEFRLHRAADEDGTDAARLTADITVEAFRPRGFAKENQNND